MKNLAEAFLAVFLLAGSHDSFAQSPLRLYLFDCGRIQFNSITMFGIQDDETDVRELVAPCYVIEHEKGRLLWDGGLPSPLAETEGWREQGGARARLDRTGVEGLVAETRAELWIEHDLARLEELKKAPEFYE